MFLPFFTNELLFKIQECLDRVVTLFSQLVQLLLTHQDLPFQGGEPLLWTRLFLNSPNQTRSGTSNMRRSPQGKAAHPKMWAKPFHTLTESRGYEEPPIAA